MDITEKFLFLPYRDSSIIKHFDYKLVSSLELEKNTNSELAEESDQFSQNLKKRSKSFKNDENSISQNKSQKLKIKVKNSK